ncbi:hypothetical protein Tsubulata_016669 [Turnera subulata]|uniref:Aminotransferase-like plant mobile domain-containing protein n=1 Tax=Turnera subulata TaxID=218843 RepID=A0A9Q0FT14_9ROSI|nr:hypothetical protein Tsubulata_016669 [Turnera subulata]
MATSCPTRSFDNLSLDILWDLQESLSLSDNAKRDRFFALIDHIGLRGPLFETWVADSLVISLGPTAINDHSILEKVCPLSRSTAIPWGRSISLRDYTDEPPLRDQYPIQTWPYEPSTGYSFFSTATLFWNSSLNVFAFPFGPLTIKLYDLSVLFGLPPHGHDFSIVSSENSIFSDEFISTCSGKSYIAVMRQPESLNTKEDHFKFLIVFFTKYLFCSRGKECTLCFVPLVRHLLESENPVALGSLVLASIYQGLHQLTTETLAWKSILAPRDLPTDLTVLKNEPRMRVEVYHPHYCAAQLGFYQHVLVSLEFSRNCLSLHDHVPFSCRKRKGQSSTGSVWPNTSKRSRGVHLGASTAFAAFLDTPGPSLNPQASLPLNSPVINVEHSDEEASESSGEPLQYRRNPSRSTPVTPVFREADFLRTGAPQFSSSPRSGSSETGETFGDDVLSPFPGHSFLPDAISSTTAPRTLHFQVSAVELPAIFVPSPQAPVPFFPSTAEASFSIIASNTAGVSEAQAEVPPHPEASTETRPLATASTIVSSILAPAVNSEGVLLTSVGETPVPPPVSSVAAFQAHLDPKAPMTTRVSISPLPRPTESMVSSLGGFSFPASSPAVFEPVLLVSFSQSTLLPRGTINHAATDHSTGSSAQVLVPLHIDELNLQRLVLRLPDSLRDPTIVVEICAVCTRLLAPPSPLGQDIHALVELLNRNVEGEAYLVQLARKSNNSGHLLALQRESECRFIDAKLKAAELLVLKTDYQCTLHQQAVIDADCVATHEKIAQLEEELTRLREHYSALDQDFERIGATAAHQTSKLRTLRDSRNQALDFVEDNRSLEVCAAAAVPGTGFTDMARRIAALKGPFSATVVLFSSILCHLSLLHVLYFHYLDEKVFREVVMQHHRIPYASRLTPSDLATWLLVNQIRRNAQTLEDFAIHAYRCTCQHCVATLLAATQ